MILLRRLFLWGLSVLLGRPRLSRQSFRLDLSGQSDRPRRLNPLFL